MNERDARSRMSVSAVCVHETPSPPSLHSASVHVSRSFSRSANPSPVRREESSWGIEHNMLDYLSPNRLRELSGETDLNKVTILLLSINSKSCSLGNFGSNVPQLKELRCVDSIVSSVRDLGTGLGNLTLLSLCHCGLQDLDGLLSLHSLQELYISHNEVKDISIVSMMSDLTVLDVQSNQLTDKDQLGYLGLCQQLSSLCLSGNPLSLLLSSPQGGETGYRTSVIEVVPHLQLLDNVAVGVATPPPIPHHSTPDLLQSHSSYDFMQDRPRTAVSPGEASCVSPISDDSSELTHGLEEVMCGNPVRALKARRKYNLLSQSLIISPTRPLTSTNLNPLQEDVVVTMATSEIDLTVPRPPETRPHSIAADFRQRRFHPPSHHTSMTSEPFISDHTPSPPTTAIQ